MMRIDSENYVHLSEEEVELIFRTMDARDRQINIAREEEEKRVREEKEKRAREEKEKRDQLRKLKGLFGMRPEEQPPLQKKPRPKVRRRNYHHFRLTRYEECGNQVANQPMRDECLSMTSMYYYGFAMASAHTMKCGTDHLDEPVTAVLPSEWRKNQLNDSMPCG